MVNSSIQSFPTAWVENTGNDLAILTISLSGVPSGWSAEFPESIVISPNQVVGLPISLIPDDSSLQQSALEQPYAAAAYQMDRMYRALPNQLLCLRG